MEGKTIRKKAREKYLQIRFSNDEMQKIVSASEDIGLNTSSYIRSSAIEKANDNLPIEIKHKGITTEDDNRISS